ncbi:MAG TPA: hypothetical protein VG102_00860 [Candidatus Paceibacterota bacterium]|jgi:hypothetical protein|nr:hypothetical protein [Candidatus Paceibacterota bacterium]
MKKHLITYSLQLAGKCKRFLRSLRPASYKPQAGFTLLLAALVASIALTLGSSIYTIVSKELILSSIGQDSQFAFYTADTAAECALYWDTRFNWFSTTPPTQTATCDGQTITLLNPPGRANTYTPTSTMEFQIDLFSDSGAGYCADVSVEKGIDHTANATDTLVIANGYSVSCTAIDTAPDALQRTVELQY